MQTKKKNKLFQTAICLISVFVLFLPFFLTAAANEVNLSAQADCVWAGEVSGPQIALAWTSTISGNPTYYVLRKIQGETTFTEITSTQNLFYTDALVNSDKNYVYQIRAEKGTNEYFSNEILTPAQYCPAVLSPPAASCQNDGPHVALNWSPVSGSLSIYEIYRNGLKIGQTANTAYDDGSDIEGTGNYAYFVKAIWQTGVATTSAAVSVTAPACPPVLTIAADCNSAAPGGPKVELLWTNLLGVQEYQIYRKAQTEANFSLLETTTQTNYADNLVDSLASYSQGGQISYFVKAIWPTDQENSLIQSADIPGCPPYLKVEAVCNSSGLLNPEMRLPWTSTKGATHYNIYRDGDFRNQITGNNYIDYLDSAPSGDCPNKICGHTYQVKAAVAGFPDFPSNSVTKNIDCATVVPPSPAPVLEAPQAYCASGDSKISLNWSPSDNVTYYSLYRVGATTTEFKLLETTYEDPGVQSGYNYNYFVSAYGKEGTNITSNSQSVSALSCVQPSSPVLSLSQNCSAGQPYVGLSWSSTTNTFGYDIYRGTSENNLALLITFVQTSPEFISRTWQDNNVSISTNYYYKVVARGPNGVPSSSSNTMSIATLSCLPTAPALTLNRACENAVSTINLSWSTDKANTSRYEIFRTGWNSPVYIYNTSVTTYKDNSVLPDTSYEYKVEAVGYSDGQRTSQGYKSITTYNCSAPGPFTLSEPMTYCQGSYPRTDLSWTASANAASYDLLRNRLKLNNSVDETNTLSNVNSPYTDFGFGNALNFDGSNDYVNSGTGASLDITNTVTVESWVKSTKNNATLFQGIVGKANLSGTELGWILSKRTDNKFYFQVRHNGVVHARYDTTTYSNIAYTDNNWHHLVGVLLSNGSHYIYIDGVQQTASYSGTSWTPAISSIPLVIGTAYGDYPVFVGYNERFAGLIDEVRVYNRALSSAEVNEHYRGIYNSESDLVGLWRFDEGSGQTVSDSSNFGNNGALGASSAVETSDPTWTQSGLQSQTNYTWQAKANGPGGSALSNTTNSAIMPLCQPTKPGLVLSSFCEAGTGLTSVTLGWSYTTATSKYEVYRQDKGLIKTINQGDAQFSSRTWADNNDGAGLASAASYTYYIKAIGPTGLTNQSDSISITTLSSCAPPTKPENLSITSLCGGTGNSYPRLNLIWSAASNTTSYTIFRSPADSPFPVSTALTSYTDTAVDVNTVYSYYVVAYGPGGGGASSTSDSVSKTTLYCAPSTPSITAVSTACESLAPANNISWSDATTFNTNSYKIYRNTTGASPAESDLTKTITSDMPEFLARAWKDNIGLSPLTAYYYWVKAAGPMGNSSFSTQKQISTYSCGLVPGAPTLNLDSVSCAANIPQANLSWNNVANAYSYNLYRENIADSSQSVYSTVRSPKTDEGTRSLKFDGVDDYAEIGNVNPTSAMTVEAWVKSDNTTGYSGVWQIVSKYDAYILGTDTTDDKNMCFIIYTYAGWQYGSCYAVPDPQNWHHFVGTYDSATGAKKLYVDGSLKDTTTPGGTIYPDAGPLDIARRECCDGYNFKGEIDEVRIYSRAISATEAIEHSQGIYKKETALKGVWHFDEGSGTTAFDQSGDGNNGALYNGPAWRTDSPSVLNVLPLENSKTYKYKVKALGVDTEGSFSDEISMFSSCLPAKPNLNIASACDGANPQLKLTWQPDSNTAYWNVYKKRAGDPAFGPPLINISSPQTDFSDNDVESGSNYEYYLSAVGQGVPSTPSDIVSETSPFCYPPPSKPVISATPKCFGYSARVLVDWDADPDDNTVSYNIYRKNTSLGEAEFSQIYAGLPAITTQYIDAVQEENKFIYKVEAVGSGAENTVFSDPSSELTSFECSNIPPFPPTLEINQPPYSTYGLAAVSLGWTDAGNEEQYKLFRRKTGEPEFTKSNQNWPQKLLAFLFSKVFAAYQTPRVTLDADILNYADYTVDDGTSYDYVIIASNVNGDTLSNTVSVYVPIALPGNFTLSASLLSGNKVYLNWTESLFTEAGGTVSYQVLRDSAADFNSPTVLYLGAEREYYDNNPTFSERYYRVVATNNGGSTSSNIVKISRTSAPTWKEIAPW